MERKVFMFVNSLLLAISSSIDSFGIGITYGIKNTRLSNQAKIILFLLSFCISLVSIWFGDILKNIFSESITCFIGSFILIFIGLFICFQAIKKSSITTNNLNYNEEKPYKSFVKFFGITTNIIKNPIESDLDNSNIIDSKEALFLGLALSLDCFSIGIGGGILGISFSWFPIFISTFQLIFFSIGNLFGKKLCRFASLPPNIWSFVSGLLIIFIGFFKLFL